MKLRELTELVFVVAHKENTKALEIALVSEGFHVWVQRMQYTDDEIQYASSIRCLLNHRKAWLRIVETGQPAIVCEADFVPCRRFGHLVSPLTASQLDKFYLMLYSNRPIAMRPPPTHSEIMQGAFIGFSNSPVCCVMSPLSARLAVDFADEILATRDPKKYCSFDNELPIYLRRVGIEQLITTRCFGEHGGVTNKEHFASMSRYTPEHRAELLARPLHFLPAYAKDSKITYYSTRFRYRINALARALCFRFCRTGMVKSGKASKRQFARMYFWGIARAFGLVA